MNYYPVIILDSETVIGTARWGTNGRQNAYDAAEEMAKTAESLRARVLNVKVVSARSREAVRNLYAGISFEKWTKAVVNREMI